MIKVGIGQDSHKFDVNDKNKKLILGGITIKDHAPLKGNSDADVVLHAITNAISSVTGVNILGKIADAMCQKGILESKYYVYEALKYMNDMKISHIAVSIECKTPKLSSLIDQMKMTIADILSIPVQSVGITATSGENLTSFGQGFGIAATCILTVFSL